MREVEQTERAIEDLSPEELTVLRCWLAEFDAQARDRRLEADVKAGNLDGLAEEALRAHAAGSKLGVGV